jgi:protein phosphatase 1 regulatory subunit 12A
LLFFFTFHQQYPSGLRTRPRSFDSSPSSVPSDPIATDRKDSGSCSAVSSTAVTKVASSAVERDCGDVQSAADEKDYKKLYEQLLVEFDGYKQETARKEQESSREKRQMQRKLGELEEELKQIETLKTDNQRLKEENGALIRVISKLSKGSN